MHGAAISWSMFGTGNSKSPGMTSDELLRRLRVILT